MKKSDVLDNIRNIVKIRKDLGETDERNFRSPFINEDGELMRMITDCNGENVRIEKMNSYGPHQKALLTAEISDCDKIYGGARGGGMYYKQLFYREAQHETK